MEKNNLEKSTDGTKTKTNELGKCPIQINMEDGKFTGVSLSEGLKPTTEDLHALYHRLTATKDNTLAYEIIDRGLAAMPKNKSTEHNVNLIFQALADFEPANVLESRFCLQANALYAQGIQYLSRAEEQEMMCHADHYMKYAIKLLRLHNETIEALNRHRRKGEQRVVVQHVNVNEGGQAAFMAGNFKNGQGGGKNKTGRGTS